MRAVPSIARAFIVLVLLSVAFAVSACAQGESPQAGNQQAVFEASVAKADAAWADGDAESAFKLYTEALQTPDSTDTGGLVAAKQEKAKRLALSRRILTASSPSIGAISSYVEVLRYASAESTEAAAARAGLVDCLKPSSGSMRSEVAEMRRAIKAGESVTMPLTVTLVLKMGDGWRTEVAQAPAPVGSHAEAAVSSLSSAAKAVDASFGRKYAQDALRDLAAADKALAVADRELAAARAGK